MAVGKYQAFVKGDEIYAMNTETGALCVYDEFKMKDSDSATGQDRVTKGWTPLYALVETIN